jgi:DNA mismatch repair protein MSH5
MLLAWTEKEIEIVYDLAQKVLQYEGMLVEASDICGELDRYEIEANLWTTGNYLAHHICSTLALTQAALSYNLCRPRIVPENIIRIKGGR